MDEQACKQKKLTYGQKHLNMFKFIRMDSRIRNAYTVRRTIHLHTYFRRVLGRPIYSRMNMEVRSKKLEVRT